MEGIRSSPTMSLVSRSYQPYAACRSDRDGSGHRRRVLASHHRKTAARSAERNTSLSSGRSRAKAAPWPRRSARSFSIRRRAAVGQIPDSRFTRATSSDVAFHAQRAPPACVPSRCSGACGASQRMARSPCPRCGDINSHRSNTDAIADRSVPRVDDVAQLARMRARQARLPGRLLPHVPFLHPRHLGSDQSCPI